MKTSTRIAAAVLFVLFGLAGVIYALSFPPVELIGGKRLFEVTGDASALKLDEGNGVLKVDLAGGKKVYLESDVLKNVPPGKIEFSYRCDGVNQNESDYRVKEARYPIYVQVIFDEKPDLSFRKYVALAFSAAWNRKIWTRRSLLYAFGNRIPKGSIVNSTVSVAIVSVGDETDVGKDVKVDRDLRKDFTLAYGKPPASGVYRIVIGFEGTDGKGGAGGVFFYGLSLSEEQDVSSRL